MSPVCHFVGHRCFCHPKVFFIISNVSKEVSIWISCVVHSTKGFFQNTRIIHRSHLSYLCNRFPSRCDVPWEDVTKIKPSYCENIFQKDLSKTMKFMIDFALQSFQMSTSQAAIVSQSIFEHFFVHFLGMSTFHPTEFRREI